MKSEINSALGEVSGHSAQGDPLDALDHRLLQVLQQDASLSNVELAARAHTSPATAMRRTRRLRESGVIRAIRAHVDWERLGGAIQVLAEVTLDRQGQEHLLAFEQFVALEVAVSQCHRVSPGPDFVLWIRVPDMRQWHEVSTRLFTQQANVRNVKTYFSTFCAIDRAP